MISDNDIRHLRSYGVYIPLTVREMEEYDEREEMLVRGYITISERYDSLPWVVNTKVKQ